MTTRHGGHDRIRLAQDQAEQAVARAHELGFLIQADTTRETFRDSEPDRQAGTEHIVELMDEGGRVGILTLPRNCYLKDGDLLPFHVILCQPDEALEAFLGIDD